VSEGASGYLHRAYAASFDGTATPRELPAAGAFCLERRIPGSDLHDGMGCYPLLCCRRWARLPDDLQALADRLVSFTAVTDPFGEFDAGDLRRAFDVVRPYKEHHVTDLAAGARVPCSRSHRRNVAAATRSVAVDLVQDSAALGDDWVALYGQLVERHGLTGIQAFSSRALRLQLEVPGSRVFRATAGGAVVGVHVWYVQGDVAYAHLGATSRRGYELMASYALYACAIERLRGEVRWLALGSNAGAPDDPRAEGLRRFKAGWATATRPVYLCGKVLQPEAYRRLAGPGHRADADHFPWYRRDERAPEARGRDGRRPAEGS
jgi:hypothetical protein